MDVQGEGSMSWGIMISLDYEHHPVQQTREIWHYIRRAMTEAGFLLQGRLFISHCDREQALQMARDAIESIEAHQEFHNRRLFRYIKEFYAIELDSTENLMLPPLKDIVVNEGFK
jgi:hypothetical protein